nr:MAG TPA: hypothetical protein [Caudoviricetes sp.]
MNNYSYIPTRCLRRNPLHQCNHQSYNIEKIGRIEGIETSILRRLASPAARLKS